MCMTCAVFNPFQTQGNWLHETGSENALTVTEVADAANNS